jgi:hypothetical protein
MRNSPWCSKLHYRGCTIAFRHTTLSRNPQYGWSARRRNLYLHRTQHSQQTDIHAPGRIRTRNPSKRAATGPRLRPLGHWDQHCDCACGKRGKSWRNQVRTSLCRQKFEISSLKAPGAETHLPLPATGLADVSSEHSRYFMETRDGSKPLEPRPTLL